MDYVAPPDIVESMVKAGTAKGKLAPKDMLIRGMLSGAILGIATTLAFQTQLQFGNAVSGGIIFPGGFVMIVLLSLELVTGNFGVVPLGVLRGQISLQDLGRNWSWVFLGNLLGGLTYAALFYAATTGGTAITDRIVQVAEAKTIAYQAQGAEGLRLVFFKAILCNWMVTMGVVMALTSNSTIGKIAAMWIPLTIFFAQGFEHSVVNMFVIPCGMLFGADVSLSDWWLWNQIPVTLGNIVGGAVFTGMALYFTHGQMRPLGIGAPVKEPALRTGSLLDSASRAEGS